MGALIGFENSVRTLVLCLICDSNPRF